MGRTITALEVQKRNKERVNVYLDGEFAFGLPLIDAVHLHQGQILSDEEIAALRALDEVTRAVDRAVALLARRPYSTAEIRRNLSTKQIPSAVIDEAITRLTNLGYLDDQAFAQYWVENRERFRPRGARALAYELRQKGISAQIIEETLGAMDAHDSATRAAQEKIRSLRGLTKQEFRSRLGAFLTRRGFGYDIVRDVTNTFIQELENEQSDYFALPETDEE